MKVAQDLMNDRHARIIDGVPAIWDGLANTYALGYDAWGRGVLELCYDATTSNRREVFEYLRLMAPSYDQGDTHLIACANGVVDPWAEGFGTLDPEGRYLGFYANDPELNITSILPAAWDPNAYDALADEVLDGLADGDPLVRANLEEVMAACVYRGHELQNMAVLVGAGGNGKSTFIKILKWLLGNGNFIAIDLRDVGQKFMTFNLAGKLADLGDDIADGILTAEQLSIVKKVVTGEVLTCDVKFQQPLNIRPYCTLVYTANAFPRLADYSTGTLDRIHGINFRVRFRNTSRCVTDLEARLKNDVVRSYLLNLALARLPDLVRRGAFTPTEFSQTMRNDTLLDNDSVAYWISAKLVSTEIVLGRSVEELYAEYREFCDGAGRRPVEQRTFSRRVNQQLGTATAKRSDGYRARVFVRADAR